MAEKVNQKERLKEITDSIETGIQELFNSEKYTQYLKTMSRFHKYSLNNTLLIALQDPNATAVCGFNKRVSRLLHLHPIKLRSNEKN